LTASRKTDDVDLYGKLKRGTVSLDSTHSTEFCWDIEASSFENHNRKIIKFF